MDCGVVSFCVRNNSGQVFNCVAGVPPSHSVDETPQDLPRFRLFGGRDNVREDRPINSLKPKQ